MNRTIWIAALLATGSALPVQAASVRYVHTDALGSAVAMTDANRNVIERREYEPYGRQLVPTLQDGPGYTGHVQDAATGLTYMQQRYYDPGIGTFLSVDPVTALASPAAGFNRYRYAASNPYRFTDPDGRSPRDKDQPPHMRNSCERANACLGDGGLEGRAESDADKAMADVYGNGYPSKDSLTADVDERLPPVARKHNVELGLRYFYHGGEYFAGDVAASNAQCNGTGCEVNLNSSHLDGEFRKGLLVGEYHIHPGSDGWNMNDVNLFPRNPYEYSAYLSNDAGVEVIDVDKYQDWTAAEIFYHAERRSLGGD